MKTPLTLSKIMADLARLVTVLTLFVATGCIMLSGFIHSTRKQSSLLITTTRPFVQFNQLPPIVYNVKTTREAVGLNKSLLDYAWCTQKTGNFYSRPENIAPACECIQNQYEKIMTSLTKPVINNPTVQAIYQAYLDSPWNNNRLGLDITRALLLTYNFTTTSTQFPLWISDNPVLSSQNISNTTLASILSSLSAMTSTVITTRSDIDFAAGNMLKCMSKRAVWIVEPYVFRLHPVILSLYLSYALFMLVFSYVFRVDAKDHVGSWSKWYLFMITVFPVGYMFLDNIPANWPYALALILINFHYVTALRDEFTSIDEDLAKTKDLNHVAHYNFHPPHPLMVGLWYFALVEFPVIVTYLAFTNVTRDVVALLGFYMIGYLIALGIQRISWTNWYQRKGMKIEAYQGLGRSNFSLILNHYTSHIFRLPLYWTLFTIVVYVYFIGSLAVFLQWYNASFYSSNWMGLSSGLLYLAFFVLSLFYKPEKGPLVKGNEIKFDVNELAQFLLILSATLLFVVGTVIDALLD